MAKDRRVKVTLESDTGRNLRFKDKGTGRYMNSSEFVTAIKNGTYPDYHVRTINGIQTPASNPDGKDTNNLG